MQPRIIPRSDHPISRKNIDPDALKVLYRLYRSGHTAFLVGGGVRDLLIGRRPKDFDVCTSARPGQVKKLFRNCWLIGRRFRLAHIHFRDHKIVEVSTFRAQPEREGDGDEDLLVRQDNTFGTPEEDALRRDFTINGLFYDIASFSLIDYVGGVDDIEAGVIRTIGDPHIRFQEDPVRMLRAIKFAARLDFAIEPETWEALCEHVEDIAKCSTSRVVEEIARLLEGGASCRSLQLLKASGLLRIVLPEVYEYIYGVPAGPGLVPESRGEARETPEAIEEELLTDEDTDAEVQERVLGVEGAPEDDDAFADEADAGEGDDEPAEGEAVEVADEEPEAEADEVAVEDDIDLSGEDTLEPDVVTPQGTRCVQAPDRGGLLWRMLASIDERVRAGCPMTRPSLFAAVFYPIVRHTTEWMVEQSGRDEEQAFMSLLRPLTASILISRRDRERVCQILAAQRKFRRNNKGFAQALSRKPYFAEALDVYEGTVLATGQGVDPLAWWRDRYPYVPPAMTSSGRARPMPAGAPEGRDGEGRRSRRRRRSGRGGREAERELDLDVRVEPLDRDDQEAPERDERGRRGRGRDRDDRVRDRDDRGRDRDDRGRDRDDRGRDRDDRGRDRDDRGRDRDDRGRDRDDRVRDRDDRGRDRDDRGRDRDDRGRDRDDRVRDRDDRGRDRDVRGRDRDVRGRDRDDRDERGRGRGRGDDDFAAPRRERDDERRRDRSERGFGRRERSDRDYDRGGRSDREPVRERVDVDEFRGEFRRREMRDIEPLDYGRGDERRSSSRGGSSRSRNGSNRERTSRRTPYREEGYRGPRGRGDEMEYYESRVGHDLTPESPRPRRDDDRRGGRRRRRKPPLSSR